MAVTTERSPDAALRTAFASGRTPGVVAAYLFGSHATGRTHRESDLDVAVLLSYERYPRRVDRAAVLVPLTGHLIDATHDNRVDLVILNDAPPELAAGVVTHGRLVYCADEEAVHAFVRTALLRHADIQPFLRRTRRLKLTALQR